MKVNLEVVLILVADIPCHPVGQPVQELDEREETEAHAETHEPTNLSKKSFLHFRGTILPEVILPTCDMNPTGVILASLK